MARRISFREGGYYHVYNRGVEKRDIFFDDKDRLRFLHDLYEFNDADAVLNLGFHHYRGRASIVERKQRKILVDLLAYALMPNHFHLLLRQRRENGAPIFMHKLGTGYAMYFNARHQRSGVLFQGRFKAKEVQEDQYLRHLVTYIHANPVALWAPNWKDHGSVHAVAAVTRKIEAYRWSSYRDYLGEKNFPSILDWARIRDLGLPIGRAQQIALNAWIGDRGSGEKEAADCFIEEA